MSEKNDSSKIFLENFAGDFSFSTIGNPTTAKLASKFELNSALNAPNFEPSKTKSNGLNFDLEMVGAMFSEPRIVKVDKKLENLTTSKKRSHSSTFGPSFYFPVKFSDILQKYLTHPKNQGPSVLTWEAKQPNLKLTPTKPGDNSNDFAKKVDKLVCSRFDIDSEIEKSRTLAKADGSYDKLVDDFREACAQASFFYIKTVYLTNFFRIQETKKQHTKCS